MSKIPVNVRLDEHEREILRLRSSALGLNVSDYLRTLVRQDNVGRFNKSKDNQYDEWREIRSTVLLNENLVALLKALKTEYEYLDSSKHDPVKDMPSLCKKYGLIPSIIKTDFDYLLNNYIIIKVENSPNYSWTIQGIIIFPEHAFAISNSKYHVSGDVCVVLEEMLGDWNEIIKYLQEELELSSDDATDLFGNICGNYVHFLTWVRETAFSLNGIIDLNNVEYYRKQMLHFLCYYLLSESISGKEYTDEQKSRYTMYISKLSNYLPKTMN